MDGVIEGVEPRHVKAEERGERGTSARQFVGRDRPLPRAQVHVAATAHDAVNRAHAVEQGHAGLVAGTRHKGILAVEPCATRLGPGEHRVVHRRRQHHDAQQMIGGQGHAERRVQGGLVEARRDALGPARCAGGVATRRVHHIHVGVCVRGEGAGGDHLLNGAVGLRIALRGAQLRVVDHHGDRVVHHVIAQARALGGQVELAVQLGNARGGEVGERPIDHCAQRLEGRLLTLRRAHVNALGGAGTERPRARRHGVGEHQRQQRRGLVNDIEDVGGDHLVGPHCPIIPHQAPIARGAPPVAYPATARRTRAFTRTCRTDWATTVLPFMARVVTVQLPPPR